MSVKFTLRIWSNVIGQQLLNLQMKQLVYMGEWCLVH